MQQTKSNLIFLYGAPAGGKTFVAQQIAKATGFQYLNLDELLKNAKNDNDKTNLLIKHLKDKPDNYIIDNFLDTKAQVIVLFEHFQKPRYVVYLQSSKDEIEQNIRGLSTEEQKKTRLKRLQIFLQNRDDLLAYLKKQKFFVTVNGIQKGLSNNFEVSSKLIVQDVMKYLYPKIMVALTYNNDDLAETYLEKLESELQYRRLHVEQICEEEYNNETPLGKQIGAFLGSGQQVPANMQIELIRKIIFKNPEQNKFILTSFPEKLVEFQTFEEKLFPIDGLISFMKPGKTLSYSAKSNAQLLYVEKGKHLIINTEELGPFQAYITKKTKFGMVVGPSQSGRTTLAKYISQKFGYILIEWEPTIAALKEKLADVPGEPLDDVPLPKLIKYYQGLFSNVTNDKYIFDGFPPVCDKPELQDQFLQLGSFTWFLNIEVNLPSYWTRYKIKNEQDAAAEITPEDEEKLKLQIDTHNGLLKVVQHNVKLDTKLFSLDTNSPLEFTLKIVEQVFEKRVYMARIVDNLNKELQTQLKLVYVNIAAKYNMTFIDVEALIAANIDTIQNEYEMRWTKQDKSHPSNFTPDRVLKLIKNYIDELPIQSRDVILWGYSSADYKGDKEEEELIYPRASDELALVEKQLGTIRVLYAISDHPVLSEINDPEWVLEKPEVPVAKVEQEGEDGEAKEPPKDEEDPEAKPKFNIFDYQWTKSEIPKNMAQIYIQVKQPTAANLEVSDYSFKMIYDNFEDLFTSINEDSKATYFIQVQLQQPVME